MSSRNNHQATNKARYLVEVVEEKPKCLLIYAKTNRFITTFAKKIKQTHEVYESSHLAQKWNKFDLVVFFGITPELLEIKKVKKIYFVFFKQKNLFRRVKKWLAQNHLSYKIVNLDKSNRTIAELVDLTIFKSPVPYVFDFENPIKKNPYKIAISPKNSFWLSLKIIIFTVLLLNLGFLLSFVSQLYLLYGLVKTPPKNTESILKQISVLKQSSRINTTLSTAPKNTLFWLPGIDEVLKVVDATNSSIGFLDNGAMLLTNMNKTVPLIIKQNKNKGELSEVKLRIKKLKQQMGVFENSYYQTISLWEQTKPPFLNRKKTTYLSKLRELEQYLPMASKLIDQLPSLLGAKTEKQYLVLFMNNMELRPGGGFIGSLAVVKTHQYSLKTFEVYDVYSLDGQLKAHLDPPEAIAKYLEQPHWFLRDSNFSPDFTVNAKQALRIIKLESDWQSFDGVFGITLSTVESILELFPDFYIEDYNEHITKDNFFLKAQSYAEKDFFPGSYKKKNFLQSVLTTLIIKLQEGGYDYYRLLSIFRQVFDEKFAVVNFENENTQRVFDELFWTGRVVSTECNFKKDCFSDYVYVVDANLGVNKANFYVQRTIRLNTKIGLNKNVTNSLVLDYYNQSSNSVFPGGTYKNYIQIFLPKNTTIKNLLVDGVMAPDYDVSTELGLRKIGVLIKVKPGVKTNVVVEYEFVDKLTQDQYQLIVQKQIGSINNDFIFQLVLPPNLNLVQTNFNPIVGSDGLVYNTFLQKDRILIVDFK